MSIPVLKIEEKIILLTLITQTGVGIDHGISLIEATFPNSFDPQLLVDLKRDNGKGGAQGQSYIEAAQRAESEVEKAFYCLLTIPTFLGVALSEGSNWFMNAGFDAFDGTGVKALLDRVLSIRYEPSSWSTVLAAAVASVPEEPSSREARLIRHSLPIFTQTHAQYAHWIQYFHSKGRMFLKP